MRGQRLRPGPLLALLPWRLHSQRRGASGWTGSRPPGPSSWVARPDWHSPVMTAKSASTSQAITSPFRMCLFTASLTLPIPSSLPPSPTPEGKENEVSQYTGLGRMGGWWFGGRAAPPHVFCCFREGKSWLGVYFQTTRRGTSSGLPEASSVTSEFKFGTHQHVAMSTPKSRSLVTDGAPHPGATRPSGEAGVGLLSFRVAPAQGWAAKLRAPSVCRGTGRDG